MNINSAWWHYNCLVRDLRGCRDRYSFLCTSKLKRFHHLHCVFCRPFANFVETSLHAYGRYNYFASLQVLLQNIDKNITFVTCRSRIAKKWKSIWQVRSVTFSSYWMLKNIVTLKSRLGVTQSLEIASFDRSHTSSYSSSIVNMFISCIVCDLCRLPFSIPLPFNSHDYLTHFHFFPKILTQTALVPKLLQMVQNIAKKFNRLSTVPNITDRQRQI